MNTAMWDHPLTKQQLCTLVGFWNYLKEPSNRISIIKPISKTLACGEVGNGALANVEDIIALVSSTGVDFEATLSGNAVAQTTIGGDSIELG
jgi:phosphopantothenoylcysteine synthetase/decarboxylase